MKFASLEGHVASLGRVDATPITDEVLRDLASLVHAPVPRALAWWWQHVGAGAQFAEPTVYFDPKAGEDVLLGRLLSVDEVRQAIDDYEESLAPHRFPIANDGGDNLLLVDRDGSVHQHLHDALLDRNTYPIADSFESFVLSLRRGG